MPVGPDALAGSLAAIDDQRDFVLAFCCTRDYSLAMEAVVLAAGRGTRMGALTESCPKPLLTVAGRPLIEHIVSGMASAGILDFVVVTGYRGDQIEAALEDGRRLGVRVRYRRQAGPDGTARGLLLASDLLGNSPFALSWGDILVQPDFYGRLLKRFDAQPCDALMAINRVDDPWQGAAVYVVPDGVDCDRVTRIVEKPPRAGSTTQWNNAGVFVLSPVVLGYAARIRPSPRGEYELPQAIAAMVDDGCRVLALPIDGYWSDVGTPEDLRRAEAEFPGAAGALADDRSACGCDEQRSGVE